MRAASSCSRVAIMSIFAASTVLQGSSALNLGKILKRGTPGKAKSVNPVDPDSKADEVLTYSTACDKDLAKSLIILSEQKETAVEAMATCRAQRDEAYNVVEFLTKKIEITQRHVAQADERTNEQVALVRDELNAMVEEMQVLLDEDESKMLELNDKHQGELQELKTSYVKQIETLKQTTDEQIENLQFERQREQTKAAAMLDSSKAERGANMQKLEQEWKTRLEKTERDAKQSIATIKADHDSEAHALASKFSTCDDSAKKTMSALNSLQRDHERALQRIAVLENVTAFSLAMEDARDFADYVGNEFCAKTKPLYKRYLKGKVDILKEQAENVLPVVMPVVGPLLLEFRKLEDTLWDVLEDMYAATKTMVVGEACPMWRSRFKEPRTRNIMGSAIVNNYVEQACNQPDVFLRCTGIAVMALFVFILRRHIYLALLWVLLLPVRAVLYPFTFFTRKTTGSSKKI